MFTVGQFKKLIKDHKLPDNCGILLSSDAEGNDLHPMASDENISLVSYSQTGNLVRHDTEKKNAIILWPDHISVEEY